MAVESEATTPAAGITIPAGCYRQPTESEGVADSGEATFTYVLKGDYTALHGLSDSLKQGDVVVEGWLARAWDLQRGNGDTGTLSIACVPDAGKESDAVDAKDAPIKDVWKIHAVRNDVSVMAYCDETPAAPQRVLVEKWLRETDSETANAGNFREKGEVVDVAEKSPPTALLIAKMLKGVESVIRFYPVITRTRTYAQPPPDCLENMGLVDDPPTSEITGDNAIDKKHPKGLAAKLALYEWLKMQDDCDETADGKGTRTESWWGMLIADNTDGHPWDPDFYGKTNRWPMPARGIGNVNNNNDNVNNNGGNA